MGVTSQALEQSVRRSLKKGTIHDVVHSRLEELAQRLLSEHRDEWFGIMKEPMHSSSITPEQRSAMRAAYGKEPTALAYLLMLPAYESGDFSLHQERNLVFEKLEQKSRQVAVLQKNVADLEAIHGDLSALNFDEMSEEELRRYDEDTRKKIERSPPALARAKKNLSTLTNKLNGLREKAAKEKQVYDLFRAGFTQRADEGLRETFPHYITEFQHVAPPASDYVTNKINSMLEEKIDSILDREHLQYVADEQIKELKSKIFWAKFRKTCFRTAVGIGIAATLWLGYTKLKEAWTESDNPAVAAEEPFWKDPEKLRDALDNATPEEREALRRWTRPDNNSEIVQNHLAYLRQNVQIEEPQICYTKDRDIINNHFNPVPFHMIFDPTQMSLVVRYDPGKPDEKPDYLTLKTVNRGGDGIIKYKGEILEDGNISLSREKAMYYHNTMPPRDGLGGIALSLINLLDQSNLSPDIVKVDEYPTFFNIDPVARKMYFLNAHARLKIKLPEKTDKLLTEDLVWIFNTKKYTTKQMLEGVDVNPHHFDLLVGYNDDAHVNINCPWEATDLFWKFPPWRKY